MSLCQRAEGGALGLCVIVYHVLGFDWDIWGDTLHRIRLHFRNLTVFGEKKRTSRHQAPALPTAEALTHLYPSQEDFALLQYQTTRRVPQAFGTVPPGRDGSTGPGPHGHHKHSRLLLGTGPALWSCSAGWEEETAQKNVCQEKHNVSGIFFSLKSTLDWRGKKKAANLE